MKRPLILLLCFIVNGAVGYLVYEKAHELAIRQGVEIGRRLEAAYTVKSVKAFGDNCNYHRITFCTREKDVECETIYIACKEAFEP